MTDEVCCLTPAGVAAIAVIGFRGPMVWKKLSPHYQPAKQVPDLGQTQALSFGRLQQGDLGDDVVLVLRGDEHHQFIEVQTHGGPGVVTWVLQLAEDLGCRRIEWDEWVESESPGNLLWALLPHAVTRKTASILLDQCHGAMDREMERLRAALAGASPDVQQLLHEVRQLRRWESLGEHLLRPWKVVLAGAPNVGKSSLFNALLGFERAITSPTPGTTRDVVTATLAWQGYPFELTDTAGLRDTAEDLEAAGIARAVQSVHDADVVLWLVDLKEAEPLLPDSFEPTFVVGTKADLALKYSGRCDFRVSAVTGEGLTMLLDAVLRRVLPEDPQAGQAVPVLPEQREAVRGLEASLMSRLDRA